MTTATVNLTPRRSALLLGHDNTLDLLLRIQAPDAPSQTMPERPALHIALVIDRSGSMDGQPLREAKRCARFVIDGLAKSDKATLVVYDNRVETLMPTQPVGDRAAFYRAIEGIHCGGTTDLHSGWLKGAESLAPHTTNDSTSRVLILSDGCANCGLTDPQAIASQCQSLADAGVSTSTYGLGGHFNETLMTDMARAGRGNSYYGQTAEDLMDPFREEFDLLNALYGKQLELQLTAAQGTGVELLNAYQQTAPLTWRLPDLAYGAEAWALLRLTLKRSLIDTLIEGGPPLLQADIHYADRQGARHQLQAEQPALAVLPAGAFAAVAEDALVKRRADELAAAQIQGEAREAAARGDWGRVDQLLDEVEQLGADNEWVRESANELRSLASARDQEMFSKEAVYSAHRMSSRLASPQEIDMDLADDVPRFLRRKAAQGKRQEQDTDEAD